MQVRGSDVRRKVALAALVVALLGPMVLQGSMMLYQWTDATTYQAEATSVTYSAGCNCYSVVFQTAASAVPVSAYSSTLVADGQTFEVVYHPGVLWAEGYWNGFKSSA